MQQLRKVIRSVDQFGSVYTPRVYHGEKEYKTVIGGIFSIILYGLSFGFFLYCMVMWGTGQNLPQVTSSNRVLDAYSLDIQSVIGSIYVKPNLPFTKIDPFATDNLIFLPYLIVQVNGEPDYSLSRLLMPSSRSPYNLSQIDIKNMTFSLNTDAKNTSGITQYTYLLAFRQCNQTLLQVYNYTSYTCANKSYIQQYYDQELNVVIITYELQQYNIQQRQMESIQKQFNIAIDENSTFYLQSYLRSGIASVDTGILFQDESKQVVISDISATLQQLGSSYYDRVLQGRVFGVVNYQLDYIQVQQNMAYQKISDVLANIGSIVSFLLMFSYFFFKLSEYLQDEEIVRRVIEMYYPDFSSVKIHKDYFGRIQKITNKDQEYPVHQFTEYYKKLRTVAQQKLTVLNQIYEISRIQLLMNLDIQQVGQIKQKNRLNFLNDQSNDCILRNQVTPMNESELNNFHKPPASVESNQLIYQLSEFQLLVYEPDASQMNESRVEVLN